MPEAGSSAGATGGLALDAESGTRPRTRLAAVFNAEAAKQLHADMPKAKRAGTATVVWRDCEPTFTNGVLVAVAHTV